MTSSLRSERRQRPLAPPASCDPGDAVAVVDGELLERRQQVGVRVARDLAARRRERRGLPIGERVGLGDVEDVRYAEERPPLAGLLALLVALLDAHRRPHGDPAFSLPDAAPEAEPRLEAGDVRRLDPACRALVCDQRRVVETVGVQDRAGPKPVLPALARQQLAERRLETLSVLAPALLALGVGQPAVLSCHVGSFCEGSARRGACADS